MTKHITFAQLEQLLEGLGFVKRVVPNECVTYEHAPTKSLLAVRLHKPNEAVPEHVLVATRIQLDGRGVVAEKDFDSLLQSVAA